MERLSGGEEQQRELDQRAEAVEIFGEKASKQLGFGGMTGPQNPTQKTKPQQVFGRLGFVKLKFSGLLVCFF